MTDFHELYTRYAKDIYKFSLYLCGNSEEAEEITAETFSRVLTGNKLLISTSVKGYLLTIARNLYLDSLRKQNKTKGLKPANDLIGPDLVVNLEYRTELEDLKIFLRTMPEIDSSALMLKAEGLSYGEISEVLNISLASAKVKVHRLRMKLAEWRMKREQQ